MQTLLPPVVSDGVEQTKDADRYSTATVDSVGSAISLSLSASSPRRSRRKMVVTSPPSSSDVSLLNRNIDKMPDIAIGSNSNKNKRLSAIVSTPLSAITPHFTIGCESEAPTTSNNGTMMTKNGDTTSANDVTNRDKQQDNYRQQSNHTTFAQISRHSRRLPSISRCRHNRSSSSGNIGETSLLKRKGNQDTKLSSSLPHYEETRFSAEESVKTHVLYDRVRDFIIKDNPGRPPLSLRYIAPKMAGEETKLLLRPKSPQLPINTNSCPNLCLLADREKWSYNNYKPGKCRYLRCPQSPVLGPEEIFADV